MKELLSQEDLIEALNNEQFARSLLKKYYDYMLVRNRVYGVTIELVNKWKVFATDFYGMVCDKLQDLSNNINAAEMRMIKHAALAHKEVAEQMLRNERVAKKFSIAVLDEIVQHYEQDHPNVLRQIIKENASLSQRYSNYEKFKEITASSPSKLKEDAIKEILSLIKKGPLDINSYAWLFKESENFTLAILEQELKQENMPVLFTCSHFRAACMHFEKVAAKVLSSKQFTHYIAKILSENNENKFIFEDCYLEFFANLAYAHESACWQILGDEALLATVTAKQLYALIEKYQINDLDKYVKVFKEKIQAQNSVQWAKLCSNVMDRLNTAVDFKKLDQEKEQIWARMEAKVTAAVDKAFNLPAQENKQEYKSEEEIQKSKAIPLADFVAAEIANDPIIRAFNLIAADETTSPEYVDQIRRILAVFYIKLADNYPQYLKQAQAELEKLAKPNQEDYLNMGNICFKLIYAQQQPDMEKFKKNKIESTKLSIEHCRQVLPFYLLGAKATPEQVSDEITEQCITISLHYLHDLYVLNKSQLDETTFSLAITNKRLIEKIDKPLLLAIYKQHPNAPQMEQIIKEVLLSEENFEKALADELIALSLITDKKYTHLVYHYHSAVLALVQKWESVADKFYEVTLSVLKISGYTLYPRETNIIKHAAIAHKKVAEKMLSRKIFATSIPSAALYEIGQHYEKEDADIFRIISDNPVLSQRYNAYKKFKEMTASSPSELTEEAIKEIINLMKEGKLDIDACAWLFEVNEKFTLAVLEGGLKYHDIHELFFCSDFRKACIRFEKVTNKLLAKQEFINYIADIILNNYKASIENIFEFLGDLADAYESACWQILDNKSFLATLKEPQLNKLKEKYKIKDLAGLAQRLQNLETFYKEFLYSSDNPELKPVTFIPVIKEKILAEGPARWMIISHYVIARLTLNEKAHLPRKQNLQCKSDQLADLIAIDLANDPIIGAFKLIAADETTNPEHVDQIRRILAEFYIKLADNCPQYLKQAQAELGKLAKNQEDYLNMGNICLQLIYAKQAPDIEKLDQDTVELTKLSSERIKQVLFFYLQAAKENPEQTFDKEIIKQGITTSLYYLHELYVLNQSQLDETTFSLAITNKTLLEEAEPALLDAMWQKHKIPLDTQNIIPERSQDTQTSHCESIERTEQSLTDKIMKKFSSVTAYSNNQTFFPEIELKEIKGNVELTNPLIGTDLKTNENYKEYVLTSLATFIDDMNNSKGIENWLKNKFTQRKINEKEDSHKTIKESLSGINVASVNFLDEVVATLQQEADKIQDITSSYKRFLKHLIMADPRNQADILNNYLTEARTSCTNTEKVDTSQTLSFSLK